MKKYSVLFVCTGNICRSPTFEGVLNKLIFNNGLSDNIVADSAGIHGYHVGEIADKRSILHAKKRGYDLSMIKSRKINEEDFFKFDLILALDIGHFNHLIDLVPDNLNSKVKLFLPYIGNESFQDVPDPYYGNDKDFELVLDLAEAGAIKLLEKIKLV